MTKYNTIFSKEEYMAQGFTEEEYPLIKEHDELFNRQMDGDESVLERIFELVGILHI